MDAPSPQRNRIHVDISVPQNRPRRALRASAAAGHLVNAEHAPARWTLADAEGNEASVATTRIGRD
jgi:4a-hydroxytetrahydrobiopterin dehydratase